MRNRGSWLVALALAALPSAARAAKDFRVHAQYGARMAAVKTVVIVTPDLKSYELKVNDQPVFRADWTDRAKENVSAALEKALQARGLTTRRLASSPATDAELDDVAPLYRAVLSAVLQATYVDTFPAQKERFEYTLGDLGPLVGDADAAVFVWGLGATSSGGRRAFQILLGSGSFALDRLMIAVVSREGDVLWFEPLVSGGYDLRDPASSAGFVEGAMKKLPKVGS